MTAPSSYARILAHHPYIVIGVIFVVVATCLVVSAVVGGPILFDDPTAGFTTRGTEISNRLIAYDNLVNQVDNEIKLTPYDTPKNVASRVQPQDLLITTTRKKARKGRKKGQRRKKLKGAARGNSRERGPRCLCAPLPEGQYTRFVFSAVDGTTLFTALNIRDMCRLQQRIEKSYRGYKKLCHRMKRRCCLPWSIGGVIASITEKSKCDEISDADVKSVQEILRECQKPYNDGLLQPDCLSNECLNVSSVCRNDSSVYLLLYFLMDTHYNVSTNHLTYALTFLPIAGGEPAIGFFKHIESQPIQLGNVRIVGTQLNNKDILFENYLNSDSVWLIVAAVLIFVAIWFYSTSLFVAIMAFFAMFWSLEVAYFLYLFVFEIEFFPYMNLVTVIIVIGIGADDVLIMCKVWFIAKAERNNGTLEKIVSDTLHHSTLTMFVTSLTTAAAFYANYISDVTAIKCFSLYSGTAMLANYIFMITWLPASIVIYEKWCNCCICYAFETCAPKCHVYNYICKLPYKLYHYLFKRTRQFMEKILPCIIIRLRVLWLTLFTAITLVSVFIIFYYPKLSLPTSKKFQFLFESHLMEMYDLKLSKHFAFEQITENMPITVVFGVKAEDNGFKLKPSDHGTLSLLDSFSLYNVESQTWLLKFCQNLRNSTFYTHIFGLQIHNCFMENFVYFTSRPCDQNTTRVFCCEKNMPYSESVLIQCLNEYLPLVIKDKFLGNYGMKSPGPRFQEGQLRALIVEFTSNVPYSYQYENVSRFYDGMNEFMTEQLLTAPDGLKHGWFVSSLDFYDLQHSLLTGVPVAIGVSMAIAGLVAFLTTLNILVSLYAVIAVVSIVHVTVACLVLLGWQLNILESVVITVTIGMSFDYTLHYGVAYRLSPDLSRDMRVISSLCRMGSPVAMAAITTFLAGMVMLPATVNIYRQFGTFLMINAVVSWVYSTVFFHALLTCVGPQSAFGQLHWPSLECCEAGSREHIDKTIYTMSESTVSSTTSTGCQPHHAQESHELEPLTHQNHLNVYHHRHRQPCRLHYYKYDLDDADTTLDNDKMNSCVPPCDSPIMSQKHHRISIVTFDTPPSTADSDDDDFVVDDDKSPNKHSSKSLENSHNSADLDGNICTAQVYT